MAITLGTFGSGLDVEAIVTALVDADIAPKTNSLDRRETDLKAEFSAIGSLKSVLSDLDKSLTDLKDGSAFDLMSIAAPASEAYSTRAGKVPPRWNECERRSEAGRVVTCSRSSTRERRLLRLL